MCCRLVCFCFFYSSGGGDDEEAIFGIKEERTRQRQPTSTNWSIEINDQVRARACAYQFLIIRVFIGAFKFLPVRHTIAALNFGYNSLVWLGSV